MNVLNTTRFVIKEQGAESVADPQRDNSEIDILQLLLRLARAWHWLLLMTAFASFSGFVLSLYWPHTWTSKAVVMASDVGPLSPRLAAMQALDLKPEVNSSVVFQLFREAYIAPDSQIRWLQTAPAFLSRISTKTPEEKTILLSTLQQGLTLTPNEKLKQQSLQQLPGVMLTAKGSSAQEARSLLESWLAAAKSIASTQAQQILNAQIEFERKTAQARLDIARKEARNQLISRIQRLESALELSHAAGIDKPIFQKGNVLNDDPDYPIQLGSQGLQRKLDIMRNIKDPILSEPALQNLQLKIDTLENMHRPPLNLSVVRVLQAPDTPRKHDGPGTLLVCLLSGLLGLMLAVFVLLFLDAISEFRKKIR